MRLVYLSPVPWASFAQRPQKFVRWYHEKTGEDVMWLDPYPSRFPCLDDFKKIGVSDRTETDGHEPWLIVLKPKALPIEPLPASGLINCSLYWTKILKKVKAFAHNQEVLLVIGKPTVLALKILKLLDSHTSVYDAMDDFPMFYTGMSKAAMMRRELQLGRNTNIVLTSSTKLREKWERQSSNVKFVPNGLDLATLPPAKKEYVSEDSKIFGYLGTVGAWFDWSWVIQLAESRPNDVVHIIGPLFNSYSMVLPRNIQIFSSCSHKDALARMLSFDVALIPFLKNELTSSVDPIKYYEYRVLGLPVMSTNFGEMAYRAEQDGVYLCDNAAEMKPAIKKALDYQATTEFVNRFKLSNSWEARFNSSGLI